MPERWPLTPHSLAQKAIVRVIALAEAQWGVISRAQLLDAGLSSTTVDNWLAAGRLHRVLPAVYALGHGRLSTKGRLMAALLYAGPGAVISHTTAAWWWGIWETEPRIIHVSTPRKCASVGWVRVHARRNVDSVIERQFPVTSVAQTLLDIGSLVGIDSLRRAIIETDHLELLDQRDLERILGRGKPGSAPLRAALGLHFPQLASTRSALEQRFLELCRSADLPLPEVNVHLEGFLVDAVWRDARLVVELDGMRDHAKPAAIERDRRRDLALRAAGFLVLRYTWQQVTAQRHLVVADLRARLHERCPDSPDGLG